MCSPSITRTSLVLLAALCSAGLATASADVLIVDDSGGAGVDHLTIQAAVDAALVGDTVLVHTGTYAGFGIQVKGVNVIAARDADVQVTTEIAVRNLPLGEHVDLVGLEVVSDTPYNRGLVASDNDGVLWIEECRFRGVDASVPAQWQFDPAQIGMFVVNCADVVVIRSEIVGGRGHDLKEEDFEPAASDGSPALQAENSSIALFECTLSGGNGGSNFDTVNYNGGRGGDGLELVAPGFAYALDVQFVGGHGGHGDQDALAGCGNGGAGGHGVVTPANTTFYHQASSATPGTGGASGGFGCSAGPSGMPIPPAGNSANLLPGIARSLNARSPVAGGTSVTLRAEGAPGDLCWVRIGLEPDPSFIPGISSQTLLGSPRRTLFIGTLDASGQLTVHLPVPTPALSTDSKSLHLQGYFRDTTGTVRLGSGAHLIVLGSAY